MTRWPRRRSIRASASPRMVERMWPTCIGLATLGELKSITMERGPAVFWKNKCSPLAAWRKAWARAEGLRRKFRKPAPATSTGSHHWPMSSLAATSVANWRGIHFARLGQRHEGVGLVIAEFRVGAWAHQDAAVSASGKTAARACCSFCSRILWSTVGTAPGRDYFGAEYFLMMSYMAAPSGACSSSCRNSLM